MIIIMIIIKVLLIQYKICLNDRVFGPKTSTSLQTSLAAEAHLTEGQSSRRAK
jgi:hypothetical protein